MSNNKGYCGICADCVPQINGGSGFKNCEEAHEAQFADRTPGEITADEELGCLIGHLKYYAAKPDMAAKQLPHLLQVVASAVEQLRELRNAPAGHFQRGYDEGHSRGLTCGKLYKGDDQMRQHRAASVTAYQAEIAGEECDG